jgi:SAM-dependent methyltransferase
MSIRKKRIIDINRCFSRQSHTPKRMLDIGFGNGVILSYYDSKGVEIAGLELSEKAVKEASNMFPNGKFLSYDGINIPFDDSAFDTIILNDILEHISYKDIELLLPEIKRVLEPDGLIYISVMNRWQLVEPHRLIPFMTWGPRITWHPISKRFRDMDYIDYWPYTRKRIERLFKNHGLSYRDMTDIYIQHKFSGANPIGDRATNKVFTLMKKVGLSKVSYALAFKVSILLYVAWEPEKGNSG